MFQRQIYLDSASGMPLYPEVKEEIYRSLEVFGNPSSTHFLGQKAKTLLEESRYRIGDLLQVKPEQVVFTSGGTESNNMVFHNAIHCLNVSGIISSKLEHPSVLNCLLYLKKEGIIPVHFIGVDHKGEVDIGELEDLLSRSKGKQLVSLMHVNNEIGNVTDIKLVGDLCYRYGAFFHSDMVQSMGLLDFSLENLNYTFVTGSAHKFGGPKGCGFFIQNQHQKLLPILLGGNQEKGLRSGTECLHNILGSVKALEISFRDKEKNRAHLLELKSRMITKMGKIIPQVHFNGCSGNLEQSAPHILNVLFLNIRDTHYQLHFKLSLKGIACSQGSACQSGSNTISHVIKEITPKDQMAPSIRFSFYQANTIEDIDHVVDVISQII